MAIKWMEGFDWATTLADGTNLGSRLLAHGAAAAANSVKAVGRFGIGSCLVGNYSGTAGNTNLYQILPDRVEGEFVVGFSVRSPNSGNIQRYSVTLYDDRTEQDFLSLAFDDTGVLRLFCGGVQVGRSRPGSWQVFTWHYIQLKAKGGDPGFAQVKVDGEIVIDITNADFTPGVLPLGFDWGFDAYRIGTPAGTSSKLWAIDDLYILDATGPAPYNNYLGNVRVGCMKPDAPGDVTGLIPVGAAANWIAGASTDITADTTVYNQTDTVGAYDLYHLQANVPSRQVFGIMTTVFYRQDNAIQLWSQNVLKTGGVEYYGDIRGVAQTYIGRDTIYDNNPNTGVSWTNADLADVQIGPKLAASD